MSRRKDNRPWLERGGATIALVAFCGGIAVTARAGGVGWPLALAFYGLAMSLLTLGLFAFDKRRAERGGRRVSEANLLWMSLLGGAFGGVLGMRLARHKTTRWTFRILVPVFLLLQVAGVIYLLISR